MSSEPTQVSGSLASATAAGDTWSGVLASVLLLSSLLLGGGTINHLMSDLVVQLLASVLLVWGLRRMNWRALAVDQQRLLILMCVVMAVPLLQLVPLPTILIQAAPGRAELFAGRVALGLELPSFAPWSLDPNATLAAFRALLPAAALAVLGCQLDAAWLKRMSTIVVIAALIMVPLGIAQVAQGAQSTLRPYVPTNVHDAVGLFANRNHYAGLLVSALALVMANLFHAPVRGQRDLTRHLQTVGWMVAGVMLLVGVMLSRSRAGVALALLVGIIFLGMAFLRRREQPATFRWLLGFAVVGTLMAFQFGFLAIADRLSQVGDHRLNIFPAILALASDFGWLGTGIGSFAATYAAHEPIEVLGAKILTHAHSDWLELWVEMGLLLIPIALLFAAWVWTRTTVLLPRAGHHALHFAGLVILLTLCAHSLVDYPLRTTTLSVVMMLACLLIAHTPTASSAHDSRARAQHRHRLRQDRADG